MPRFIPQLSFSARRWLHRRYFMPAKLGRRRIDAATKQFHKRPDFNPAKFATCSISQSVPDNDSGAHIFSRRQAAQPALYDGAVRAHFEKQARFIFRHALN
jgi:hypothetical protein